MAGTILIIGIIVAWIVVVVKFISAITKPDDWFPVWSLNAEWMEGDLSDMFEMASYEIEYSKKRKRYRLILHGYKPKLHAKYAKAVEVFNRLQNTLSESDNCVEEALQIINRK